MKFFGGVGETFEDVQMRDKIKIEIVKDMKADILIIPY